MSQKVVKSMSNINVITFAVIAEQKLAIEKNFTIILMATTFTNKLLHTASNAAEMT